MSLTLCICLSACTLTAKPINDTSCLSFAGSNSGCLKRLQTASLGALHQSLAKVGLSACTAISENMLIGCKEPATLL